MESTRVRVWTNFKEQAKALFSDDFSCFEMKNHKKHLKSAKKRLKTAKKVFQIAVWSMQHPKAGQNTHNPLNLYLGIDI